MATQDFLHKYGGDINNDRWPGIINRSFRNNNQEKDFKLGKDWLDQVFPNMKKVDFFNFSRLEDYDAPDEVFLEIFYNWKYLDNHFTKT